MPPFRVDNHELRHSVNSNSNITDIVDGMNSGFVPPLELVGRIARHPFLQHWRRLYCSHLPEQSRHAFLQKCECSAFN